MNSSNDDCGPNEFAVAWILSGSREKASSRLQGFVINDWFCSNGVKSEIIASDFNSIKGLFSMRFVLTALRVFFSRATHIVFEAPEWLMCVLAMLARQWGKTVIAVRCDAIPGEYDNIFDSTILPTSGLSTELGVVHSHIIEDVVEVADGLFKSDYRGGNPLKVVWVGHQGYAEFITQFVNDVLLEPGVVGNFDFELISVGDFATKQWSEATVMEDILSCDIAILPIPPGKWFKNKSSNRLAMMFALGMPVVATCIPSYMELAVDGKNMLEATTARQFALQLARFQSASLRQQFGLAARDSIGDRFTISSIGGKWLDAIKQTVSRHEIKACSWKYRVLGWLFWLMTFFRSFISDKK